MICALIVHGPALPRPLTRLSPWLDRLATPIEAVVDDLERQPWRRVIKTHTPFDGLPCSDNVDYVFCSRDVRDATPTSPRSALGFVAGLAGRRPPETRL